MTDLELARADKRFQVCLPYIFREEGGYGNNPHDSGGATNKGIIQKEYNAYRMEHGLAQQSVAQITEEEAELIYYFGTHEQKYWLPVCPKLPAGIDLMYFNCAVNSGQRRAAIMLQASLDIKKNSVEFKPEAEYVGPDTVQALADCKDLNGLAKDMHDWYDAFYRRLPGFPTFGDGWIKRNNRIYSAAAHMLPAPVAPTKETTVTDQTVTVPASINVKPLTQQPVSFQDILHQIEAVVNIAKTALPIVATFYPPLKAVVVFLPVLDEVLAGLEDAQNKSGTDLIQSLGQRLKNIGAHFEQNAQHVQLPQPQAQPMSPVTP